MTKSCSAPLGGSANLVSVEDTKKALSISTIQETQETEGIKQYTKSDELMTFMREWAEQERNGYKWVNDIGIRERLDDLGKLKRQICLPKLLRKKILLLAHERFGH